MAKKDPAFLFYSKDWIEGTAEMLPEEKGVYIDLLCHQHQKGGLPTDTKRLAKIVGLAEQEFLFIWACIKQKFQENDNRLYNHRLTEVITERSEKGEKNKIIGTLAAVVRLSKESYEKKKIAKAGFDYKTFLGFTNQNLTEAITEWFNFRLKSIANANEDANTIIKDNREVDVGFDVVSGKWNTKPNGSQMDLLLPEVKVGAVVQLFKFSKNTDVTNDQVETLWSVFKAQNFNGVKFYQTENDVFSHFINWANLPNITIQTIKNGANNQPFSGNNHKSPGSRSNERTNAIANTGLANRKGNSAG